ncbi:lipoprotein signal peptidase [Melissococcus plutonius DAT561]|uniref:Lipoprotein signal peptidase n=1 Tax=Melissococcus plutonius TaxID=33970 RepID=A0A2Z5Y291_9ENTE|nr:signal peptidase II [Melissococcus plutonius]BAL62031.1 lipoprotein signal peptidase [Melissococcus plutonius DAT561]BBC60903.1 lipoprotein signal peptidase [Melissococcus plutonius]
MIIIYFFISLVIIGLDQWSKYLTVTHLMLGETKTFIPNFLSFTYLQNTGAAWSLLEGKMLFFIIITVIVGIELIYLLVKFYKKSYWLSIGLSFVLAGALGNFIDRIRLGYVVDMIQTEFIHFPIFNVADSSLVVGVICIIIYLILDEKAVKGEKNGKYQADNHRKNNRSN